MSRHTTYLSGPMTGVPEFNFPTFIEAARDLRCARGWAVLSPAERDIDAGFNPVTDTLADIDLHGAMADDFRMVMEADSITMLPGWENSRGARAERFVAEMCGKHAWQYNPANHSVIGADAWDGNPHLPAIYTTETRITDPVTGGSKGSKQEQLGALDPLALLELAAVAGFGGDKYERYNFLKGYDWSLSFDAMQRHALAFWAGEDRDPESGKMHMAHVAWHGLALTAFLLRERGTDDRPR